MSAVPFARLLARLALKVAVAFGIAFAVAAIQAPFRRDDFVDGLVVSSYALGGFLLVMGALGGAAYGRVADAESRGRALGSLPGLPSWAQRARITRRRRRRPSFCSRAWH
jgi:hypothetical protein